MNTKLLLTIFAMFILLLANIVYAQIDIDQDGIKDELDNCQNTMTKELPIIKNNFEYLGCSCKQIKEKLFDPYCAQIKCGAETELIIKYIEEPYELTCSQTYCINDTLYDFETLTQTTQCSNGNLLKSECTPIITKNSSSCKKGIYPEFSELKNKQKENNTKNNEKIENYAMPDYTNQIYAIYRSNDDLFLKNSYDREEFKNQITHVQDYLILVAKTSNAKEQIGKITMSIQKKEIVLEPVKQYGAKNVLVFEKIISEIDMNKIIYENQPYLVDIENKIIIWKIDELYEEQRQTINYKVPLIQNLKTQTIVIGQEKKEYDVLLPIILVLSALILMLAYVALKRKIKKDREK
ncbi:hypothetical protein K9L67_03740 [Candidatus Woesearchaeota archaeon]|nr:hypothetical protein [Candidatus Woesearchaeota archaeon]MCF7901314.1 hypothetical protein [Candidatus Woesearchaeota archaeon]MCF8013780.1 hypothetical protein [Candidatus Woesearchaeota archaeon]